MKRILVAVVLLIACGWATYTIGVEANGGAPITTALFDADGTGTLQYVFPQGGYPPSGFTLWSADGSAFWFQRRFADGINDTVPLPVLAGTSFLVPSPSVIYEGGQNTITIWVGAAADTVFALPWFK